MRDHSKVENVFLKYLGRALGVFGVVFVVFLSLIVGAGNEARRARFTVDVLEQYLEAYRLAEGRSVASIQELPDFYLISPGDSLSLKASDLKQGIHAGYIYDYQSLGHGKFVISASPVGLLPFRQEFAITESGTMRMNIKNVDAQADGHEEVQGWPVLTRIEKIRSKDLPEYSR